MMSTSDEYSREELIHGEPLYATDEVIAGIAEYPTTPGQTIMVLNEDNLFMRNDLFYDKLLVLAYEFGRTTQQANEVVRCGFAYDGHSNFHFIPMHGLSKDWTAIVSSTALFNESYPGYLWTKNAPELPKYQLDSTRDVLRKASQYTVQNNKFSGDVTDSNLFARLIRDEIPSWRIWEGPQHVAFLTPFPNSPGYTVLIPRQHLPSDIFSLANRDYRALMHAAKKVAKILQDGFGTARIGMFFEGYEIDYAHVKLVPIVDPEATIEGPCEEYHEQYPGYITTRLGPRLSDIDHAEILRQTFNKLMDL